MRDVADLEQLGSQACARDVQICRLLFQRYQRPDETYASFRGRFRGLDVRFRPDLLLFEGGSAGLESE